MKNTRIAFFIALVGLSGIAAQVILLREFLVSFHGNELTIGIILANWLLGEAGGAAAFGTLVDRKNNVRGALVCLQFLFSAMFISGIYFSRVFKDLIGVPFGEGIGLGAICITSFCILVPISFCHGALFSASCKLCGSIPKTYAWETAGTILGGLLLTYCAVPHLNSFQIAFLISIANLLACLFFFKKLSWYLKSLVCAALACAFLFTMAHGITRLDSASIKKQWSGQTIVDYRNSVYGNIAAVKKGEQLTFFHNGVPVVTTPYPDMVFTEEFANFPLLFHPAPKRVLVLSAGAGGLIDEMLKSPLRRLDYTEMDPALIASLKSQATGLLQKELSDARVHIINRDGRYFLRSTKNNYDLLIIGASCPDTLETNRYFSKEFFALALRRLSPGGILALWMPGAITYLSPEYQNLNAGILAALAQSYPHVRVIAGDYTLYLASASPQIQTVDPALIAQRMHARNVHPRLMTPEYLEYRLNRQWQQRFYKAVSGAQAPANSDFLPSSVFAMLMIWNQQFSPRSAYILGSFRQIGLTLAIACIILFCAAYYSTIKSEGAVRRACLYSIASTGFFSMTTNLLLIFSFQTFYGYIFNQIGILISIYMAGIAAGSMLCARMIRDAQHNARLFLKLEAGMAVFAVCTGCALYFLEEHFFLLPAIFTILFFITGFFLGGQFPLAVNLYQQHKNRTGEAAGTLYAADLIGGWGAGILAGVYFLPLLGVYATCLAVATIKLCSALIFICAAKALPARAQNMPRP